MKILIVGSGGREHAIAASVAKSPRADKIYCAPGNAGIAEYAECVDIGAMEFEKLDISHLFEAGADGTTLMQLEFLPEIFSHFNLNATADSNGSALLWTNRFKIKIE